MKRFLYKLSLRLATMTVVCACWAMINWPSGFYASVPKGTSYGKLTWIHDKLSSSEVHDQSVLFLGSSICMNSVNDSLLNAWDGNRNQYVNLGLPHTCFALVHEVLENVIVKEGVKPKKVYLCLKSDAIAINIHKMYPLVADAEDMVESIPDGNVLAVQSLYKRMAWNNHFFTRHFKFHKVDSAYISSSAYGHRKLAAIDSAKVEEHYKKYKQYNAVNFDAIEKVNAGVEPDWKLKLLMARIDWIDNAHFQKQCVRNSIALLDQMGIDYDIIMYPNFVLQRQDRNQVMLDYYYRTFPEIRATGHEIICFDGPYLKDARNWIDMNHLNSKGSNQLTEELFSQIR